MIFQLPSQKLPAYKQCTIVQTETFQSAEVDPNIMRPLIRGAPAVLKGYLVGKRNEIRRDVAHNKALLNPQAPRRPIPTWAYISHDIVTYAKEIGWDTQEKDPSAEI